MGAVGSCAHEQKSLTDRLGGRSRSRRCEHALSQGVCSGQADCRLTDQLNCSRVVPLTNEALQCHRGNGFVEDQAQDEAVIELTAIETRQKSRETGAANPSTPSSRLA